MRPLPPRAMRLRDQCLLEPRGACAVISVFIFDFQLSVQFLWGSALVILSAYLYATAPSHAEKPKAETEMYKPIATPAAASDDSTEGDEGNAA